MGLAAAGELGAALLPTSDHQLETPQNDPRLTFLELKPLSWSHALLHVLFDAILREHTEIRAMNSSRAYARKFVSMKAETNSRKFVLASTDLPRACEWIGLACPSRQPAASAHISRSIMPRIWQQHRILLLLSDGLILLHKCEAQG